MASIVTGFIGLMIAFWIMLLIRRDRLHVNHGTGWVIVAVCFALLGFAPSVIDLVAGYLGISYPPILGLTVGGAFLVIKILRMDIEHSRLEIRNQRLIQRVAMLESDLNQLQGVILGKMPGDGTTANPTSTIEPTPETAQRQRQRQRGSNAGKAAQNGPLILPISPMADPRRPTSIAYGKTTP